MHTRHLHRTRDIPHHLLVALAAGLPSTIAGADERRFTYVHESTVHAPGEIAYEQFVTWKTDRADRPGFNRVDFRHEIEFGVVEDFQTTNHVPEALHRLTEIYLVLGLRDQARKTAAVLGYNYPGSEWYQDSYSQLADDGLVATPDQRGRTDGWWSRTWRSIF